MKSDQLRNAIIKLAKRGRRSKSISERARKMTNIELAREAEKEERRLRRKKKLEKEAGGLSPDPLQFDPMAALSLWRQPEAPPEPEPEPAPKPLTPLPEFKMPEILKQFQRYRVKRPPEERYLPDYLLDDPRPYPARTTPFDPYASMIGTRFDPATAEGEEGWKAYQKWKTLMQYAGDRGKGLKGAPTLPPESQKYLDIADPFHPKFWSAEKIPISPVLRGARAASPAGILRDRIEHINKLTEEAQQKTREAGLPLVDPQTGRENWQQFMPTPGYSPYSPYGIPESWKGVGRDFEGAEKEKLQQETAGFTEDQKRRLAALPNDLQRRSLISMWRMGDLTRKGKASGKPMPSVESMTFNPETYQWERRKPFVEEILPTDLPWERVRKQNQIEQAKIDAWDEASLRRDPEGYARRNPQPPPQTTVLDTPVAPPSYEGKPALAAHAQKVKERAGMTREQLIADEVARWQRTGKYAPKPAAPQPPAAQPDVMAPRSQEAVNIRRQAEERAMPGTTASPRAIATGEGTGSAAPVVNKGEQMLNEQLRKAFERNEAKLRAQMNKQQSVISTLMKEAFWPFSKKYSPDVEQAMREHVLGGWSDRPSPWLLAGNKPDLANEEYMRQVLTDVLESFGGDKNLVRQHFDTPVSESMPIYRDVEKRDRKTYQLLKDQLLRLRTMYSEDEIRELLADKLKRKAEIESTEQADLPDDLKSTRKVAYDWDAAREGAQLVKQGFWGTESDAPKAPAWLSPPTTQQYGLRERILGWLLGIQPRAVRDTSSILGGLSGIMDFFRGSQQPKAQEPMGRRPFAEYFEQPPKR